MTKFQFFARFGQTILVRKMEEKSNRILPNQAKSHVQDSPVSNNMISNECMKCMYMYHMKGHIVSYNFCQKNSKSKIHIFPIYEQTDSKPEIVHVL